MNRDPVRDRYDVVVAGARVAGASTAMLLARQGLRVLVIDPVARGRDTLSTHALMRGAVVQLARWGLLDRVREAGTPRIGSTTFHYGAESIAVEIRSGDGVDGLYAPRRTVLDPILVDEARAAGAQFEFGLAVQDLIRDPAGRVRGVVAGSRGLATREFRADLVIGADGMRSRVARLARAGVVHSEPHATASIYGYWTGLDRNAYHWFYGPHGAIGTIPTNAGEACVFASMGPSRFHRRRSRGLDSAFRDVVRAISPELATRLGPPSRPLRGFAGAPTVLREATGPGWALVGDAGYFKDPLTAHGITDALRDAELLARAVISGDDTALLEYQATRDDLARDFMQVTSRVASFDWSLEEVKRLHLELSRQMRRDVDLLQTLEPRPSAPSGSHARAGLDVALTP